VADEEKKTPKPRATRAKKKVVDDATPEVSADPERSRALVCWNINPVASSPDQAALRTALEDPVADYGPRASKALRPKATGARLASFAA